MECRERQTAMSDTRHSPPFSATQMTKLAQHQPLQRRNEAGKIRAVNVEGEDVGDGEDGERRNEVRVSILEVVKGTRGSQRDRENARGQGDLYRSESPATAQWMMVLDAG